MDQMPGIAQWPIFKQVMFVMAEVLNFIFDTLQSMGVVNVAIAAIFFSLFYQILLLPLGVRSVVREFKTAEKTSELKRLEEEYKDSMDNPVLLAEYQKKQKEIQAKGKPKKGSGCLVLFVQIFIIMCMLNVLAYMNICVRVLSALDETALSKAYYFWGLNLADAVKDSWWPSVLLAVFYVAIFWLPDVIKKKIEAKKDRERWLSELSEEDRLKATTTKEKKDSFSFGMGLLKLVSPAMALYFSVSVPMFFVVYWIANVIWKAILLYTTKLIYKKFWLKRKNLRKNTTESEEQA